MTYVQHITFLKCNDQLQELGLPPGCITHRLVQKIYKSSYPTFSKTDKKYKLNWWLYVKTFFEILFYGTAVYIYVFHLVLLFCGHYKSTQCHVQKKVLIR